jgi:hypothetical protein
MFAVIALNGNVMNADIRHIPIVVSSSPKSLGPDPSKRCGPGSHHDQRIQRGTLNVRH